MSAMLAATLGGTLVAAVSGEAVAGGGHVLGAGCDYAVEMVFLQDSSGSFYPHVSNLAEQYPQLMRELDENHPGSKYMLAAFTDLPVMNFGCGSYDDVPFRQDTEWLSDPDVMEQALTRFWTNWGGDLPEAQLIALAQLGSGDFFSDKQFTPEGKPIKRFIIMSTDARWHSAGDVAGYTQETWWKACEPYDSIGCCDVPFDDYTVKDFAFDGTVRFGQEDEGRVLEDYPTLEGAAAALAGHNVNLITLIGKDGSRDEFGNYVENFVPVFQAGGVPTTAVQLTENSANLMEAILKGLEDLEEPQCITTTTSTSTTTTTTSTTVTTPTTEEFTTEPTTEVQSDPTSTAEKTTTEERYPPTTSEAPAKLTSEEGVEPPATEAPESTDEDGVVIPPPGGETEEVGGPTEEGPSGPTEEVPIVPTEEGPETEEAQPTDGVVVPPPGGETEEPSPTQEGGDGTSTTSSTSSTTTTVADEEDGGLPMPVVIGAAAGGVAIVGGLAGLLGAKFAGAGAFGSSTPTGNVMDNMDVPDAVNDREMMQEINVEDFIEA